MSPPAAVTATRTRETSESSSTTKHTHHNHNGSTVEKDSNNNSTGNNTEKHSKQDHSSNNNNSSHQPAKKYAVDNLDMCKVKELGDFLGVCDPNRPIEFMQFVDRCQEFTNSVPSHGVDPMFKIAALGCMRHEAYHWYLSVKSQLESQTMFLKLLQRKFRDMVLARATRDLALLEPETMEPHNIREFLETFYSLADVIEHFNKGTNVYGLLYKRLYKHEEIKKHLMGPGRESDLLTNCMDIKAITLREEYVDSSELIQRAMSTSSKHLNSQ